MNKITRVFKPSLWTRLPIYHIRPAVHTISTRRFSKLFTTSASQTPTNQVVNKLAKGHSIATTGEKTSVKTAAQQMIASHIGCLIVTDEKDDNKMVGVVTERDCMRAISDNVKGLNDCIIRDIMTMSDKIVTATNNISSEDCFKIMLANNIRHLPLLDEKFIVCRVLSIKDVAAAMISETDRKVHEKEEEAEFWAWRAQTLDEDRHPGVEH
eukprot:553095_1